MKSHMNSFIERNRESIYREHRDFIKGDKMGKLSRDKGKRGEREVVALFKEHGYDARRGQQFRGTKDSPDVIHNMYGWYVEVKFKQQLNLYDALDKADAERQMFLRGGPNMKTEKSVVFHRKNSQRWLVTLDAHDFLGTIRGDPDAKAS
jgi:hypothetical protein